MKVAAVRLNILLRAIILKDLSKSDDCFSFVSNCYHLVISVRLVEVHSHFHAEIHKQFAVNSTVTVCLQ